MIRADERRSGRPQSFGQLHLDAGDRQPVVLHEDVFQNGAPTLAAQSIVRLLAGEKHPSDFHVMHQECAPYLKDLA
jgi:hypothetical protein